MKQNQFSNITLHILKMAYNTAVKHKRNYINSYDILRELFFEVTEIQDIFKTYPSITRLKFEEYDLYVNHIKKLKFKPLKLQMRDRKLGVILTDEAQIVLKMSLQLAQFLENSLITPEHILLSIFSNYIPGSYAINFLKILNIPVVAIYDDILKHIGKSTIINDFFNKNFYKKISSQSIIKQGTPYISKAQHPIFKKYTKNITEKVQKGLYNPIIGRKTEINRLLTILLRKTKSNCLLIGEPGVGKTAIIEGLALLIKEKKVSPIFFNLEILQLDFVALTAGTRYRGDFEERFIGLIRELKKFPNFILVIDQLHKIIRKAGSSNGSLDIGNILKPLLARSQIKCIGTSTNIKYSQIIQKDSALDRRFQIIKVLEPTIAEAISILYSTSELLEKYHGVEISDLAISTAVVYTHDYINDRFLPDKAIDLLDETCAYVKSKTISKLEIKIEIQNILKKISLEKNIAILEENFLKAEYINAIKTKIDAKISKYGLIAQNLLKVKREFPQVQESDILSVISSWVGIPLSKISQDETEKLLTLETTLQERIIGQNIAVSAITSAIRRTRIGLKNPNRPLASFFFAGPTGVGKTELVKALAFTYFGSENSMIRLDMSEYSESHTISKLIGAPPGYAGFEAGGILTEKVRKDPYTIVLFDEIEKAHENIHNILLQILDDGRLTDSQSRLTNFKNTLIILTSNVGAQAIQDETARQLFDEPDLDDNTKYNQIFAVVNIELKKRFRPEFLNRFDDIIIFKPLGKIEIRKIANILLNQLVKSIQKRLGLMLIITNDVKEKLSIEGFDPLFGARPLRRAIADILESKLSTLFLQRTYLPGSILYVFLNKIKNIEITEITFPVQSYNSAYKKKNSIILKKKNNYFEKLIEIKKDLKEIFFDDDV